MIRKTYSGICGMKGCSRPRLEHYYCEKCQNKHVTSLKRERQYRRLLGFCMYCFTVAEPGRARCARHREQLDAASTRYKALKKKARGWKLVRVEA